MKHLYLLLLCIPFSAQSQSINLAVSKNSWSGIHALEPTADGGWLAAGFAGLPNLGASSAYVLKCDSNGQILKEFEFNLLERSQATAILPLADGGFVVGGYAEGCDFGYSGFLRCYKPNNTLKWEVFLDQDTHPERIVYVNGMTLLPNNKLAICGEDQFVLFDLNNGAQLGAHPFPFYIYDIAYEAPINRLILATNEGIKLADPEFIAGLSDIQEADPTNYRHIAKGLGDSTFYVLSTQGRLNKIVGAEIVQYKELDFTDATIRFHNDKLALATSPNGSGSVLVLDENMNTTQQFTLAAPNKQINAIGLTDNNILLAGEEFHSKASSGGINNGIHTRNVWMQSYTQDGISLQQGQNAAITDLQSAEGLTAYPSGIPGFYPWHITGGDFSVRVQNKGTETLQQVTVNSTGYGYDNAFICYFDSYIWTTFYNLDLAPGADTLLHIGNIDTPFAPGANPFGICFWVSSPNERSDEDFTDDGFCGAFPVTVGTDEPATAGFLVYPNPATDQLTVETTLETDAVLRIFNMAGQLVHIQQIISGKQLTQVDISSLQPGSYLLQTGRHSYHFIKQP